MFWYIASQTNLTKNTHSDIINVFVISFFARKRTKKKESQQEQKEHVIQPFRAFLYNVKQP